MLLMTLLLVAAPAAQPCIAASSTQSIVECHQLRARAADADLNSSYGAALARVPGQQARQLQAAQRAWIAYRDANCRAYAAGEGTIARIEATQCVVDTTIGRARELERFGTRH
jgi:uncharacterized protein YecT (DUF1311 family)